MDYGCGKGRVGIFLNNQIGCRVIGIDFNERRIRQSNRNLMKYYKNKNRFRHSQLNENNGSHDDYKPKIQFIHSKAEEYVPDEANCFYFFNPFSTKIFQKVFKQIKDSYERNPRKIYIFFYYLSKEYRNYFPTNNNLILVDDIDCRKSFLSSKKLYKLQIYTLRE